MARRLLQEFGGIDALLSAPCEQLLTLHGVGVAKATQLKAIHEIGVREVETVLIRTRRFSDPESVGVFLCKRIGSLEHEVFACLFLSAKREKLSFEILFHGSVDRTHVHARQVLKRGLELNAAAAIICHNHPSGNAEPSQADIALTRSLSRLLAEVEIRLLDHIVLGARAWVSFQLRGLI